MTAVIFFCAVVLGCVALIVRAARRYHAEDLARDSRPGAAAPVARAAASGR